MIVTVVVSPHPSAGLGRGRGVFSVVPSDAPAPGVSRPPPGFGRGKSASYNLRDVSFQTLV